MLSAPSGTSFTTVVPAAITARRPTRTGTITCNYNGYEKRRTVIEDQAFIGSDTQLVAPVRVGRRAVIAAGTTVVKDVPDGALSISRAPQVDKPGYADQVAARYAATKASKDASKTTTEKASGKPARG